MSATRYAKLHDTEVISEIEIIYPAMDAELALEMHRRNLGKRVAAVLGARDRRHEQAQSDATASR